MGKIIDESEPWFPTVIPCLASAAARELLRPIGLSQNNYCSNSYLNKSNCENFNLCHQFLINGTNGPRLEQLSDHHTLRYEALGLRFPSDHNHSENATAVLQDAINTLSEIPSLQTSIKYLVLSVHILAISDDAYDVSHSDPKLPFSIFLSVPNTDTPRSTLRVLEALVHEAMHLQLSLLDMFEPLLLSNQKLVYSPWMDELRPLLGVLHGMYVFSNVLRAFELLSERNNSDRQTSVYMDNRVKSIKNDLLVAREQFDAEYLTNFGKVIFGHLR